MNSQNLPPVEDAAIWELWLSVYQLPAMAVATELGVFAHLASGAASADDVATRLDLDPRATSVLLDMLAAVKLLSFSGGVFELCELARTYLVPTSPFFWGPLLASPLGVVKPLRDGLMRALKPPPEDREAAARPVDAWAEGTIDPAMAARVTSVMHCHSLPAARAVAASGNFAGARRVLDVAGGSGCFAIAIAQRDPAVRCTVLELAAVCEITQRYIADGGVADRVDTHALDMFRDPWPTGYDAALLSNVFHDWEPARNAILARRAFEALPSGGKLFLHEMLLGEESSSPTTAGFSMLMLLSTKGRQYRFSELRELLAGAGFTGIEVRPGYARYSLVVATRP